MLPKIGTGTGRYLESTALALTRTGHGDRPANQFRKWWRFKFVTKVNNLPYCNNLFCDT